jgi:ribosomal protein S18 acetylase RimI-like enzyme
MSNEIESLVRINKSQAEPAIEALKNAFKETYSMKHYLPKEVNRENAVRFFISIGIHTGIKYGEVYATSSNYEGAAIWLSSDNLPISTWKMFRSVSLMAILGFVRNGGLKMMRIGEYIEKAHKCLAPSKHWYLQTIGVDPKFQGKGYAGRLIRPMLEKLMLNICPVIWKLLRRKMRRYMNALVLEQ